MIRLAASALSWALMSISSPATAITPECDLNQYKGAQISFLNENTALSIKGKRKTGASGKHPYITNSFSSDNAANFSDVRGRSGVIDTENFIIRNEGSSQFPEPARYYPVIKDDCTRAALRISESDPVFQQYWSGRGEMRLTMSQFLRLNASEVGLRAQETGKELVRFRGDEVVLIDPPKERPWMWPAREPGGTETIDLSDKPAEPFRVIRVSESPFSVQGRYYAPYTMVIEGRDKTRYNVPGAPGQIMPWEVYGKGEPEAGDPIEKAIAHWGLPSKTVHYPILESDQGGRWIEDEMLRDRLSDGSSIKIVKSAHASIEGHRTRVYFNGQGEDLWVLVSPSGEIIEANN